MNESDQLTNTLEMHIGTKLVKAAPMSRGEYNNYRGWQIPPDEDPNDKGFLIVYEHGYESWSPKDVFEKSYREVKGLNFGLAIEALKMGKRVSRSGWNGKGMFLYLVNGRNLPAEHIREGSELRKVLDSMDADPGFVKLGSHIAMKAADNSIVTGWLASQTDMLADDWQILE